MKPSHERNSLQKPRDIYGMIINTTNNNVSGKRAFLQLKPNLLWREQDWCVFMNRELAIDTLSKDKANRTAVAAAFLAFVVLMLIFIAMPTGRFVLVVTNPANGPATLHDIISEAGGSFVDATRFDWMAVAYSDAEGFPARLMKAGAILVIDHAFAAGCTERTRT